MEGEGRVEKWGKNEGEVKKKEERQPDRNQIFEYFIIIYFF